MKMPNFLDTITENFNRLTGGGDHKNKRGESALYRAVRAGNRHEVKSLLRSGADPNLATPAGMTPLHEAAYWGERDIMAMLLDKGGDPTKTDEHGWTPLHAAAVAGGLRTRRAIIELLIAKGADDMALDKHGWSPRDYMSLWDDNPDAAEKLRLFLQGRQTVDAPPMPPKPPKPH